MKVRYVLMSMLMGVLLTACTQSTEAPVAEPAVDVAAEEAAVRAVSARWLELAKAKDSAGAAALFDEDGVLMRQGQETAVGAAAIQEAIAAEYASDPGSVIDWSTEGVEVARSGDLAVELGEWRLTGLGADGTGEDHGTYMTLYRKVGGEWKVAADASASTVADED